MAAVVERDRMRNFTPPALPPEPPLCFERFVQELLQVHVGRCGIDGIDHAARARLAIGLAEETERQLAARRERIGRGPPGDAA